MFAFMVAASGLFLHQMKQRSDKASDTFDPDAVHDATIVSEMRRCGSMKSISSSLNLNTSEDEEDEEESSSSLRDVSEEMEEQTEARCRFCFQDETAGDLIAPCACTGS